ncbi:MAG TPA: hypothetical protein VFS40_06265 [Gemmatimonadales bacterium]|nr:hypothetical protein [Gemmatimonadales bacterium]
MTNAKRAGGRPPGAPPGLPHDAPLVVRWTIGDVSREGFEALRLSILGARRLFGAGTRYVVCVNSVPVARAQALTGAVPPRVEWLDVSDRLSPALAPFLDGGMAEGVGWKFAPARLAGDGYVLALDNDCILWARPRALRHWLEDAAPGCLLAEDVAPMFGQFQALCGSAPRNTGIRGLPPGFDLAGTIRRILEATGITLRSELDEQGVVTLACSRLGAPHVVPVDDVAICGPFAPHRQTLGRCGAHFVGLNAKRLPWERDGRAGHEHVRANWRRLRPAVLERLGVRGAPPGASSAG